MKTGEMSLKTLKNFYKYQQEKNQASTSLLREVQTK